MASMTLLWLHTRYRARAFLGIKDQRQGVLLNKINRLKARPRA
ncbi:hypothetical protein ACFYPN_33170 [Streptomyces sp. NPDC005576]